MKSIFFCCGQKSLKAEYLSMTFLGECHALGKSEEKAFVLTFHDFIFLFHKYYFKNSSYPAVKRRGGVSHKK